MKGDARTALFISHANPEDNAFTIWLGAKLSAAGYEVWADVLRLKGGQDWQRKLEDALRHRTIKVLVVATPHGVEKQGVRNEIQIAYTVSRAINDNEFIIPLRLAPYNAPFLIAQAQYIDFERSWAHGLGELFETLSATYNVPRAETETAQLWRDVHLLHAQELVPAQERLISNWLGIDRLPPSIRFHDFRAGVSIDLKEARVRSTPWSVVPHHRGFLSFASIADLQDHFGPELPLLPPQELPTERFVQEGWSGLRIPPWEARKQFSDLVRQALEALFRARSLVPFEMANRQLAWWGPVGSIPAGQVAFRWGDEISGRRQIVGFSQKRRIHWHFGVSASARLVPLPHVRFGSRLLFTQDGRTPLDDATRMHRLRRSFAKSWRNARWRDMMLAFLYWLANGSPTLEVRVGSADHLTLSLPPLTFLSQLGTGQREESIEEDDDPDDDESEMADADEDDGEDDDRVRD